MKKENLIKICEAEIEASGTISNELVADIALYKDQRKLNTPGVCGNLPDKFIISLNDDAKKFLNIIHKCDVLKVIKQMEVIEKSLNDIDCDNTEFSNLVYALNEYYKSLTNINIL